MTTASSPSKASSPAPIPGSDTSSPHADLVRERDLLRRVNSRLSEAAAASAELLTELDTKNEKLRLQQDGLDRLNGRLAQASAQSAESVAELEEKNDALSKTNYDLARANAFASELVAQVEEKNAQIVELNSTLAGANARASELYADLDCHRQKLQAALEEVRTLQGIIPICMYCRDVRDPRGDGASWQKFEQYVEERSSAQFSHGLCPDCLEEHFPDGNDGCGDEHHGPASDA